MVGRGPGLFRAASLPERVAALTVELGRVVELLPWGASFVIRISLYPETRDEPARLDGPRHVWTEHHLEGGKV